MHIHYLYYLSQRLKISYQEIIAANIGHQKCFYNLKQKTPQLRGDKKIVSSYFFLAGAAAGAAAFAGAAAAVAAGAVDSS